MGSWIIGLICLSPGLALGLAFWWERNKRAKAEAKVASLLAEIKELDVLFQRATGKMKALEAVVTRKDASMAKMEKKIAALDAEWLVSELFGDSSVPPADPDANKN